jgi:hypothetical protein
MIKRILQREGWRTSGRNTPVLYQIKIVIFAISAAERNARHQPAAVCEYESHWRSDALVSAWLLQLIKFGKKPM